MVSCMCVCNLLADQHVCVFACMCACMCMWLDIALYAFVFLSFEFACAFIRHNPYVFGQRQIFSLFWPCTPAHWKWNHEYEGKVQTFSILSIYSQRNWNVHLTTSKAPEIPEPYKREILWIPPQVMPADWLAKHQTWKVKDFPKERDDYSSITFESPFLSPLFPL